MLTRSRFVLGLCTLGLCHSISLSAPPRDEVLRLVPDDCGICLLVQNLRDHAQSLQQSPFAERLAASSIGKLFRDSPEAKKLAELDKQLTEKLNITWSQLRDDILGDAVVLAYTPGPPEHPEREQGLLIVHSHKPDLLAALIDRLNEMQRRSGELRALEPRQFGDSSYIRREKKVGEEFYALRGSLFVFSDSEARLQKALEHDRPRPAADQEGPKQTRRLKDLDIERNFVTLWVNPRAFDEAIKQQATVVRSTDLTALKILQASWSAIDGAALSIKLDSDLAVVGVMHGSFDKLPAPVRKALDAASKPAAVWSAFPEDALTIAVGRVPWDADTAPSAQAAAFFGRSLLENLLRQLGPEWGVCVIGPKSETKSIAPAVLAAIQLSAGLDQSRVVDTLDGLIRLTLFGINNQQAPRWRLAQIKQDAIDIRVIEGPNTSEGLKPAFACKAGYLVFGSTPEAILSFNPRTVANAAPAEIPIARLSLTAWANYLKSHRVPLATWAAEMHHLNVADVNSRLDRLIDALALFDIVEVTEKVEPTRVAVTVKLRTAASLQAVPK